MTFWNLRILNMKTFLIVSLMWSLGNVGAQLTSGDASEGGCTANIGSFLAPGANPLALLPPRNYYVPMGSQALYRHYAEALLGRPLANETELAEMKLRIWYALSLVTNNTAFQDRENPPNFQQVCTPKSIAPLKNGYQVFCTPLSGSSSADLNAPGIKTTVDSLLWTDNISTWLVARCPYDNVQDYKVLSTSETVSEPSKTIILEKLHEVGFDLSKLYYMNYD